MKRYVIDTNALISFVTDRNPEQQQKVASLFESAAHLKVAILCHQHVLNEFIYVMDRVYGVAKDEINRMIGDLIAMPGIEVVHDFDFKTVLSCWHARSTSSAGSASWPGARMPRPVRASSALPRLWTARRVPVTCLWTCKPSAAISSRSPATKSAGRPALACCGDGRNCSTPCRHIKAAAK